MGAGYRSGKRVRPILEEDGWGYAPQFCGGGLRIWAHWLPPLCLQSHLVQRPLSIGKVAKRGVWAAFPWAFPRQVRAQAGVFLKVSV